MRLAVLLLVCCLGVFGAAARGEPCRLPDMRTDARPAPQGGPTDVHAGIWVLDFLDVDDLNQAISLDLRLMLSWEDPRLSGLAGCRFGLGEVWFPPVMMANSSDLREALRLERNRVSIADNNGRVEYLQRYTGEISSYHDLHDFPFDQQMFRIDLLTPDFGPEALRLVADTARTGLSERLNIEGWEVKGVTLDEVVVHLPAFDQPRSVLTLWISADRSSTYYAYRVLLPLICVVAMSWTIFWVPPARFEFQIGLGATAMLTTIAFSLSIADKLPDLGYLTTLDKMLIWAIVLVFLSMVEALVSGLLVLRKHAAAAARLDRAARYCFPALLLGGWILAAA